MLLFEDAFLQVKNEIEKALTGSPLIIREYLSHLTLSQGKYIRAFSVLTASLNADGMVADDAVKAAAAIEVLHLASLVHDDIIDDSELRRGSITLQKQYGKKKRLQKICYRSSGNERTGARSVCTDNR